MPRFASPITFQSTPPSREATAPATIQPSIAAFQSTPPSREATAAGTCKLCNHGISIHASLAGGDDLIRRYVYPAIGISIHASLAGGDLLAPISAAGHTHFNPRLPRGRRQLLGHANYATTAFQSTPPSREATLFAAGAEIALPISIHASLAGGDSRQAPRGAGVEHFNPRLPRGRRLPLLRQQPQFFEFQSTPPSREATSSRPSKRASARFQSTPPSREATHVALR